MSPLLIVNNIMIVYLQIANAVSTSASTSADLNGGAVKDACMKLRRSLESLLKSQAKHSESTHLLKHWKEHGSWYKPGEKNYWPDVCDSKLPFISYVY